MCQWQEWQQLTAAEDSEAAHTLKRARRWSELLWWSYTCTHTRKKSLHFKTPLRIEPHHAAQWCVQAHQRLWIQRSMKNIQAAKFNLFRPNTVIGSWFYKCQNCLQTLSCGCLVRSGALWNCCVLQWIERVLFCTVVCSGDSQCANHMLCSSTLKVHSAPSCEMVCSGDMNEWRAIHETMVCSGTLS